MLLFGALAKSPSLTDEMIEMLARDKNTSVRHNLVINPIEKSDRVLICLANDKAAWIRTLLAKSSKLPKEAIQQLAKDEYSLARDTLISQNAKNGNIPVEVLYAINNIVFAKRLLYGFKEDNSWNQDLVLEIERYIKKIKDLDPIQDIPNIDRRCLEIFGWRTAGEKKWQIFGDEIGGHFSAQMSLFPRIDGFFRAGISTKGNLLVLHGAVQKDQQNRYIWWLKGKLNKTDLRGVETRFSFLETKKNLG